MQDTGPAAHVQTPNRSSGMLRCTRYTAQLFLNTVNKFDLLSDFIGQPATLAHTLLFSFQCNANQTTFRSKILPYLPLIRSTSIIVDMQKTAPNHFQDSAPLLFPAYYGNTSFLEKSQAPLKSPTILTSY